MQNERICKKWSGVVKNEVFVKCGEVVLRCASWKLLRESRLRNSVTSAVTVIKATGKSQELMGL